MAKLIFWIIISIFALISAFVAFLRAVPVIGIIVISIFMLALLIGTTIAYYKITAKYGIRIFIVCFIFMVALPVIGTILVMMILLTSQ
jgi:hypothetical protein